LTPLILCAEMARFGKNGSDAASGAVRAARAFTGRERIVCCGYHGWQDWYIGSTSRNAGAPKAVRDMTYPFPYNDLASLERILEQHAGEFAAVIMELVNFVEPAQGFLEGVQHLALRHGALLIFDEICSGFHFGLGGALKLFVPTPHLACFGKAMGNGFPISCVLGRLDVMRTFEEIFYVFTFAGEVRSMAAAMKVLDILEQTDALARLESNGRTLLDAVNAMAREAGLGQRIQAVGQPQWALLKFSDRSGGDSPVLKNLFQQESVKRGILLLATHNVTATHDTAAIQQTLEAYAEVMKTLAAWAEDSNPARFLEGPTSQPVFRVR
jgi:glutamate-1-semialdehyde aminotransferase